MKKRRKAPIKCPHCDKEFHVALSAVLPAKQTVTISATFTGEYVAAEVAAGLLTQTTKLLKAVAENVGGKVEVFLAGMALGGSSISFDLLITTIGEQQQKDKTP